MKMICIRCPLGCHMQVEQQDGKIFVSGNTCKKGEEYAVSEISHPKRMVTSCVKVSGGDIVRLPVKTSKDIDKDLIFCCLEQIEQLSVSAPIKVGEVLIKNVCGTDADIVATRSTKKMEG